MTRQQVIALLGEPLSSTSNGAIITMEYDFSQQQPAVVHSTQPSHSSYYVMIGHDERVRGLRAQLKSKALAGRVLECRCCIANSEGAKAVRWWIFRLCA